MDEEVIAEYLAAIERKEALPPVEIVDDGTNKWLWDGAHRVECAKRLGGKAIRANVRAGTLDDAIRLAAGANVSHGLRRSGATTRGIIEWLLFGEHSPFRDSTQRDIADMVKVSQPFVARVKKEFLARTEGGTEDDEKEQKPVEPERQNRTGGAKKGEKFDNQGYQKSDSHGNKGDSETALAVTPVEVQRAPEVRFPIVDGDGVEIPEHLKTTFYQIEVFDKFASGLSNFKKAVTDAIQAHPEAWARFNDNQFRSLVSQTRSLFTLTKPALVCPYCGAVRSSSCDACKGSGFISEQQTHVAARDLRNINRARNNLPLLETK